MADGLQVKLGALLYATNENRNAELYHVPRSGLVQFDSTSISSKAMALPSLEIRPETIREEATVYAVFAIE